MNFRGFKVHIAVLVMLVTFGALFGASYLYRRQHQERPLARDLAAVAPIRDVSVTYYNNRAYVDVRLGLVPDISKVYGGLERVVEHTYGEGRYALSVSGDPDQQLDDFYANAQYYVWQSIQQGNYADMAAAILADAQARGLTGTRFAVTAERVFLQAASSDGHYLYVIVPRTPATGGETR
ncbi:MAG: hypothetical protein ACM3XN_04615 [Chloroflexota bacterium]